MLFVISLRETVDRIGLECRLHSYVVRHRYRYLIRYIGNSHFQRFSFNSSYFVNLSTRVATLTRSRTILILSSSLRHFDLRSSYRRNDIILAFVLSSFVLFAKERRNSAANVSLAVIAERNVTRPTPPSGFSFAPF